MELLFSPIYGAHTPKSQMSFPLFWGFWWVFVGRRFRPFSAMVMAALNNGSSASSTALMTREMLEPMVRSDDHICHRCPSLLPVVAAVRNKFSSGFRDLATGLGEHVCLSLNGQRVDARGEGCVFVGLMVLWLQQRWFWRSVDSGGNIGVITSLLFSSLGRGSFRIDVVDISWQRSVTYRPPAWIRVYCSSDGAKL